MRHKKFKTLLELSFYNEITDKEKRTLDAHIRRCDECQAEQKELRRFHSMISERYAKESLEVSKEFLDEARAELHAVLLKQERKDSLWTQLFDRVRVLIVPSFRTVLGGVAFFIIGICGGYFLFSSSTGDKVRSAGTGITSGSFEQGETRSTNVRFMNPGDKNGEVEFMFDAVTPVHVKGSLHDERVQKVLAKALMNNDNPGVRLRSVTALAAQTEQSQSADPAIKNALIAALKTDGNVGVRREALRALTQLPFDDEIKNSVLYALMHDSNAGIRIAAINGLELTKYESRMQDSDIVNVLRERMHSDNNNYIRYQARNVLQEVTNK